MASSSSDDDDSSSSSNSSSSSRSSSDDTPKKKVDQLSKGSDSSSSSSSDDNISNSHALGFAAVPSTVPAADGGDKKKSSSIKDRALAALEDSSASSKSDVIVQHHQRPSLKRKRRNSASDESSLGWDPDGSGDDESSQGSVSLDVDKKKGSTSVDLQHPSQQQMDVAITSSGEADTDTKSNNGNADNYNATNLYSKPPERIRQTQQPQQPNNNIIRYQMLGAPTLLYRHAPSYLNPTQRPSTLTPQQLSMAIYMNEHPMKDWFKSKDKKKGNNYHPSNKRSAFLTSTNVPQPCRPWGRPHDLDMRQLHSNDGTGAGKRRKLDVHQQQKLRDAEDLVQELNSANRRNVRLSWCDDLGQKGDIKTHQQPPNKHQQPRKVTGFNLFCSAYIDKLVKEKPTSASLGPEKHYQYASNIWRKKLSAEKRDAFDRKAANMNSKQQKGEKDSSKIQDAAAEEAEKQQQQGEDDDDDEEEVIVKEVPKHNPKKKGKTTGFNIFRSEYMKSHALSADAAPTEKASHLIKCGKSAGAVWKEMPEDKKAVYKEMAKKKNEDTAETTNQPQPRKRIHGWHVFWSDYLSCWKEDNSNSSKAYDHRQLQTEASQAWHNLPDNETASFDNRARTIRNENVNTARPRMQKGLPIHGSTGKTTGFNIFRTESWNHLKVSHPCDDKASKTEKQKWRKKHMDQISANWKAMSEEEKNPYKLDATRRNELSSAAGNGRIVKGDNDKDDEVDTTLAVKVASTNKLQHDKEEELVVRKGKEQVLHSKRKGLPNDVDEEDTTLAMKAAGTSEHQRKGGRKEEEAAKKDRKAHRICNKSKLSSREKGLHHHFHPFRREDIDHAYYLEDVMQSTDGDGEVGQLDGNADPTMGENTQSTSMKLQNNRNGVGGPSGYGNCLLTIPCHCERCNQHSPSWFLVHPTGENLSSLAVSKLYLPQESSVDNTQGERLKIDVGSRILQLARCGSLIPQSASANQTLCLVIRTSQYCSIVYAKAKSTKPLVECDEEEKEAGHCAIAFYLQAETRIDLRAPSISLQPSFIPCHVSCDPKTTVSFFTCPSFVILSRDYSGNCTTIHRVLLKDEPNVTTHDLSSSLAEISLIECCPRDRMVIWAAARSDVMPKPSTGFFKRRTGTPLGYGHSLFRIDLRDNSTCCAWSPSSAEYLPEGIHSINGIMPDATKQHILWVNSSSACKMWAIDVRYKSAKVVVSWSLPSLSDDFGTQMSVTGPFGAGALMSQPINCSSDCKSMEQNQPPVMFSVKKDPSSQTLGVYQFPSITSRFHTRPLESAGFQEVPIAKFGSSSIARSTSVPLPDVSPSIFNIGLTTLYSLSKLCLDEEQLNELACQMKPANMTHVITMTSLGDMYCHSLLRTDATQEPISRHFPGLPVGTKAIPVHDQLKIGTIPSSADRLSITLSNEFPTPSSAIHPSIILETGDCCIFKSYDIENIMNRKRLPEVQSNSTNQAVAQLNTPKSIHELSKSKLFNLNDTNHVTFKVASSRELQADKDDNKKQTCDNKKQTCDNKKQTCIHHSEPRFRAVAEHPSSQEKQDETARHEQHDHPISLPSFNHQVVAMKETGDIIYQNNMSNNITERPNVEMDQEGFKRLMANYYLDEPKEKQEDAAIKHEWESDSE